MQSYAASFGAGSYPEKYENLLKKFHVISLREDKYLKELENLCGKVRMDIDPAMLLTEEQYKTFITGSPIKKKFIFVYLIGEQVNLLNRARKYAEANNCKVITNKHSPEFFFKCSPEDFLNWVYYADCVFTNSFHGTVFSILFHKKFTVECKIRGGITTEQVA